MSDARVAALMRALEEAIWSLDYHGHGVEARRGRRVLLEREVLMKLNNEMAAHWFKLPLTLRRRWWEETEYGKKEPSDKLRREVDAAIGDKNDTERTA
ncbi:MAG TPA: hypothetical protein VFP43_22525 [Mesorhizobium sp.]|nr:hypothetical protein [Mesorhizobium sp.]